jgi:hypothetical protein
MMVKSIELKKFLEGSRTILEEWLGEAGEVLYSSKYSICANNAVAYWGFNPGQNPEIYCSNHKTIKGSLDGLEAQEKSLINTEQWANGKRPINGNYQLAKAGECPYQVGVRKLLTYIDSGNAIVSNFIFFQTARATKLKTCPNYKDRILACWKVHELMLTIAGTKVLITTPGVVEEIMRHKLIGLEELEKEPLAYSNWRCRLYRPEHCNLKVVLTTPHMSYWGKQYKHFNGNGEFHKRLIETLDWVRFHVAQII